ncbi:MAG: leucyl/phenylalanyl-tRNA--protein transferase [Polyangiales bacterium]
MAIRWLTHALKFPPAESADDEGVVAVGGDCSVERLLLAYRQGIFPWPMARDLPLFWFSPDPRYVIDLPHAHIPRSLRKRVRRRDFEIKVDTDFAGVLRGCASTARPGQRGTWITPELRRGYLELHREGYAHSVEAWRDGALVGGLYGLALGGGYFGESMFALEPDASKVAFATLLGNLIHWNFNFVDCQTRTEHLERFNAVPWPRRRFLDALESTLERETRRGVWAFDLDPVEAIARVSE